ncbi:isoprenylcysteine carboxyl methyltransferase [Leptolyngbya sp. Heron Island J]|uniref:protein-S-isoprenylcysteine O-methyltransferase n=1 Tax=Leptolyngbya sp. Heron Island J TaxID=1385935 RepID=UPI0003B9B80C|nr:protein-S-isoprenylcysteine O-methyltransferase [Leptolyngbya sp. Heron Island J]ESA33398.1 isoprenylcysteine carboxyl methyltransferase [Leptolyngbya sp. Heron Island J]
MDTLTLKIIFLVFFVLTGVIRKPYQREIKSNTIIDNRKTPLENGLLACVLLGMFVLPLIYIFTPLFNFVNYSLPVWANVLGIVIFAIALYLFWRSHHDLGKNWSPTLQVREDHTLITNGIYQSIRHPMYTAIWLWSIAQALLLTNWIAGLSGVITFGTLYFFRVGNEEKMMLEQFGEQYQAYRQRTKRLVPFLF